MTNIAAGQVLYIKLGEGGIWEAQCIRDGTLRIGYRELPHELCTGARWTEAITTARAWSKDQGAATRHVNQVRLFYEAAPNTLWVTFHSDRLWWCFADSGITQLEDGTKVRRVKDHWHDADLLGRRLFKTHLSGKLLAVQGFQGTICSVGAESYVLNKINATLPPPVAAAQTALDSLQDSLIPLIQSLHPKDFEVFVDLIFRQAGWQRSGDVGGIERDIDLDLLSPVTGERIAVQLKSRATLDGYEDYRRRFSDMRGYARFYFVTHSPSRDLEQAAIPQGDSAFIYWGPQQLAQLGARNGLTGWLMDKYS
jgi:hypothetical protein